jgi:hypothetical protein
MSGGRGWLHLSSEVACRCPRACALSLPALLLLLLLLLMLQ